HTYILYKMPRLIRTVKVKTDFDPIMIKNLLKTANAVFNKHVEWSFDSKSYNKNKAHAALYSSLREEFPDLPSGIIQSTRDMALENIKRDKFKFKPSKKTYSSIRLDKRNCALKGQFLTISTLGKRQKSLIKIPKFFQENYPNIKFCGLQLIY